MPKRRQQRTAGKKELIFDHESLEKVVADAVTDCVGQMGCVRRLDEIAVEKIDSDAWGDAAVYYVKGYIQVQVRIGIFSTKPGVKVFSATVRAKTGEVLAVNWEPGKVTE